MSDPHTQQRPETSRTTSQAGEAEQSVPADIPPGGKLTLWQSIYVVLAALLGVRSRAGFRRDLTYGNPVVFVLIGFVLFSIFCAILWVLVKFLVAYLLAQQGI